MFDASNNNTMSDLEGYDQTQVELMKDDMVILVDENDQAIGPESKYITHLKSKIEEGMLHRAFSVFLFNTKGELLLHQRAGAKITFPLFWTNTCCSHPLYVPHEMELDNDLGVKRAAIRKLEHELGIPASKLSVEDFTYVTRFQYKALYDDKWGEHEIDHVLLIKKDLETNINPNEVEAVKYFTQEELKELLARAEQDKNVLVTPWFRIICERFLFKWWNDIEKLGTEAFSVHFDRDVVHRF